MFDDSDSFIKLDKDENIKTLGLYWNPRGDNFIYQIKQKDDNYSYTKRSLLSIISSLLDPLGLLAPTTVPFKVFIQELWCANLQWDEVLPVPLAEKWNSLYSQLKYSSNFKSPRLVKISSFTKSYQLHGFCDVSSSAYGACLFTRSVDSNEHVEIYLLCSKSRIAPVKKICTPRLELDTAVLLSCLFNKVKCILGIRFDSIHFWSDSKVVLYWLSLLPSRWKIFVANRVQNSRAN
ncbi:uncharacterized protein LOC142322574 [Lycorma delicatula]|uniref:uncharacterized protein LOC142322574 n=1 Tax=Lycorma delicatula TaxID=130591 RepID=UPI003F517F3A